MENTQVKTGPKDVFLHLLAIITLYVSAGSFIALIFQYINVYLPDKAIDRYYSLQSAYASMRWSIALLFVVYPVYVWASWYLNKEYLSEPEKRDLKIRKWLLYFTLFAAALLIIGDLVTLIYNFLQGGLTARFLYKVLTVLLVAAVIFKYYLMDLKNSTPYKTFAYAVSAIVAVAVVGGFFVAGSPQSARLRQLDAIRVENLQVIQGEIVNYWQQKGTLPPTLADLTNSISGFIAPKDPAETEKNYEYRIKGDLSFELCADFALPSLDEQIPSAAKPYYPGDYGIAQNWDHPAGHFCFDRIIDKDFYQLPEKTR